MRPPPLIRDETQMIRASGKDLGDFNDIFRTPSPAVDRRRDIGHRFELTPSPGGAAGAARSLGAPWRAVLSQSTDLSRATHSFWTPVRRAHPANRCAVRERLSGDP